MSIQIWRIFKNHQGWSFSCESYKRRLRVVEILYQELATPSYKSPSFGKSYSTRNLLPEFFEPLTSTERLSTMSSPFLSPKLFFTDFTLNVFYGCPLLVRSSFCMNARLTSLFLVAKLPIHYLDYLSSSLLHNPRRALEWSTYWGVLGSKICPT